MIQKLHTFFRSIFTNNGKQKNTIENNNQQYSNIYSLLLENNWSNVFNSAIVGSKWFRNTPLNVGRWAANYSLLYVLYRVLNEIRPANILEFGLGETTLMLQSYRQFHNDNAFCITVEHSNDWIDMRLKNGLSSDYINILKTDIEHIDVKGFKTLAYKNLPPQLLTYNKKFNLILVDGPFGSNNYSRFNIVELAANNLIHDDFIIIMDDYNRNGERETFEELKKTLTSNKYSFEIGYYSGSKEQVVLVSKNYKYLISL